MLGRVGKRGKKKRGQKWSKIDRNLHFLQRNEQELQ